MGIKKHKKEIIVKESERNEKKRIIPFKWLLYSLLCGFVFLSCSEEKVKSSSEEPYISKPLTEEKCVNFAEQLHHSFADSSVTYVESYIAWEEIRNDITKNDPLRIAIFDSIVKKFDVGNEFVELVYSESDVRFITYFSEEDNHYLVFRVFQEPQSLNFYEFELRGNADEIEIVDVYNYFTASSIRQMIKQEIFFWEGFGEEWYSKLTAFIDLENAFRELISDGKLKEAFLLTKKYAEEFGELERFQNLYGMICEISGSSELMIGYLEDELLEMSKLEKGRWLSLFYLRSLQGDYSEAMIALSNLEKEVGEDLYIDFLKGNLYYELHDYESAIKWFNIALGQKEDVKIFHLAKAHSYAAMGQFVEAVESLLVMEDYFEIDGYDWKIEFAYASEFVQSPEFNEFLKRLDGAAVQ